MTIQFWANFWAISIFTAPLTMWVTLIVIRGGSINVAGHDPATAIINYLVQVRGVRAPNTSSLSWKFFPVTSILSFVMQAYLTYKYSSGIEYVILNIIGMAVLQLLLLKYFKALREAVPEVSEEHQPYVL